MPSAACACAAVWGTVSKSLLKIFLVLGAILVGLVIGELLLRVVADEIKPVARGGTGLLFSSQSWELDTEGAVRYQPNREIRAIAVRYGQVAYDVRFHTNNLGFIDHRNYPSDRMTGRKYYAFVGDSFTAGYHAGEPWVPRLRDDLHRKGIEIYNLGIDGTGIEHFRRLLISARHQLHLDAIVVLAISHDFQRGFWQPQFTDRQIAFCGEKAGKYKCNRIAGIVRPDVSRAEILDRISPEDGELLTGWIRELRLLTLVKRASRNVSESFGQKKKVLDQSLVSLQGLRAAFPKTEIHLIHLPEQDEVATGRYRLDIAKPVAEMGIEYFPALDRCVWSKDMFLEHDKHPNGRGYRHIARCVSDYLFSPAVRP